MKAFASALLFAGVHAATSAIEFDAKGEAPMVTLSSPMGFLKAYGKDKGTGVIVGNDSKSTWTVSTNHAKKQFKLTLEMVGSHDFKYAAVGVETFEIYQCWKDGVTESFTAGLYGMRCHLFSAAVTVKD